MSGRVTQQRRVLVVEDDLRLGGLDLPQLLERVRTVVGVPAWT